MSGNDFGAANLSGTSNYSEKQTQQSEQEDDLPVGTLLGEVEDATDGHSLVGVQVVAEGVLDPLPFPFYLPLLITSSGPSVRKMGAPAARAMLTITETATFTTTTDAKGQFQFIVPAGDYTLNFSFADYTGDQRARRVRTNEVLRLDPIRLHVQDPVVTEIDMQGGVATNSLDNSSLEFEPGTLADGEEVRVTYVDNADLPEFFPDGSIPMGFSSFEPEGAVFPAGKEVLWTVEYTGTLPTGTDTLCYWWNGEEQRWKDPVPGKVVDLGDGKRALQAKVPHFSIYGHALPPVLGQEPGQAGAASVTNANAGEGADQFT
ncbi:MAG: hypothetical protein GY759_10540 [Chloroflexi bacterium]|nr:hypothetical protein [Chloroflexota bacterium]